MADEYELKIMKNTSRCSYEMILKRQISFRVGQDIGNVKLLVMLIRYINQVRRR